MVIFFGNNIAGGVIMNMKKNNKMTEFIKKKGFYIGLYSAAAIIVALAGVISLNNINMINNAKPDFVAEAETPAEPFDFSQLEAVDKSEVKSYLESSDASNDGIYEEAKRTVKPKPASEATAKPVATAKPAAKTETKTLVTPAPKAEVKQEPAATTAPAPQAQATAKPAELENRTVPGRSSRSISGANEQGINPQEGMFSFFNDNQLMSWPVEGEIVMDYSMDTAIYDKTLEQYRTNNSLCISAPVGTQVKATSEGVVTAISNSRESGNTVVISHGNGWLTTYSQLQGSVLVNEGQVVKEGDVIGGVGEPSNYSILLGPHLEFKISKEGSATDPKLYLAVN